jgi:hypothetical protein
MFENLLIFSLLCLLTIIQLSNSTVFYIFKLSMPLLLKYEIFLTVKGEKFSRRFSDTFISSVMFKAAHFIFQSNISHSILLKIIIKGSGGEKEK